THAERAARHLEIAERLADRPGVDRGVVAHHLVQAGSRADPERVHEVCRAAADDAAAIGAWGHSARYATAALDAATRLHLSAKELAELELRAGRAGVLSDDAGTALPLLRAAIEHARAAGEYDVWGDAVIRLARQSVEEHELVAATASSVQE